MVVGHAVGIAAVAVCVLHGHQRDVPAYSMNQLCAVAFCRSCTRWHNAERIWADRLVALVVAPCGCLRACAYQYRGAVGASHPLSRGKKQLQRRSSPPLLSLAKVVFSEDGASPNCRFPWNARCSRCSSTSCAVLRGLCVYGRSLCILLRPTLEAHVHSQYAANC